MRTAKQLITCGDWDLRHMLPRQCELSKVECGEQYAQWVNVKKSWQRATRVFPKGMMPMLQQAGITHIGHHHSGIDDCRNIVNIVTHLMTARGFCFDITTRK